MPATRRSRSWILSFLLPASLSAFGCQQTETPAGAPVVTSEPEPDSAMLLDTMLTAEQVLDSLLTYPCDHKVAPTDNEQHDCQRLAGIQDGQFEFGPLAGIFPDTAALAQKAEYYDTARAIAHVTNAGALIAGRAGGYPGLGIGEPSFVGGADSTDVYCLWLQRESETDWKAAIVPIPSRSEITNCGSAPGEWNLQVVRQTYGELDLQHYPNTVRWQWTTPGETTGKHYIGAKCGAAWCAMGDASDSSFVPPEIPDPSVQPDTARAVPGFHDEQFLAVMGDDGTVRPGPWGAVYPASISERDAVPSFRLAARYEVQDPPGRYEQKLGLEQQGGLWVSELYVKTTPAVALALYVTPAGHMHPAVMVRTGSKPHSPHGTSRFRWHDTDETTWVPCQYWGCCDVEEGG